MTGTRDTRRHYLQPVPDNVTHWTQEQPPDARLLVHPPDQSSRVARFSYRYWAVGMTIAAQLVIAGAIALGGDPIIGAGAAIVMLLCGLALIAAEVVTRRAIARSLAHDLHLTDQPLNERGGS